MNILTRFKDIMASNINALLDKCEDPAKMIDQYLRNLREDLADVKKETAGVMAEETRTKRLLDDNKAQIDKYMDLAEKALKAGNEEDAKVFIAKKQTFDSNQAELERTFAAAHDNAQKMREMHDKLVQDIQSLETRKATVKAKVAVAKTQTTMNKISGSMESSSASMQAFERMEDKATRMLDEANSMAELNKQPKDTAAELEEKYEKNASAQSVDDELAKLKSKLGL